MQCLNKLFEGDKIFYSKISLIINFTLLIENIFIIIFISMLLLNLENYIQIYLLYCLLFSLLLIIFAIILEFFNKKNVLFNNKILFAILISYLFLTINIILISLLFGALIYEFKEENKKYLHKKYIIFIIVFSNFILFTLLINIIIFHAFRFFDEDNVNNNSEQDSNFSKSTKDSDKSLKIPIFENINEKIYYQEIILENISQQYTDSYTQTKYYK